MPAAFERIVVLTGSGISAESGIATFRGPGGLWEGHSVEDIATPEGFQENPALVHRFYNERRMKLLDSALKPNAAHVALAELERNIPETFLVTQNIDDLHEKAGSRNVVHMHGRLTEAACTRCEEVLPWVTDIETTTPCPACKSTGSLRPNIVWFGEMPMELPRIYAALHRCDLFISVGTSGNVYPAAGFVEEVRAKSGCRTVELNLVPSEVSYLFQERRYGPATGIVPEFVRGLLV